MNFRETGWRSVNNRFCIFKITEKIRKAMDVFPGINEGSHFLTFGYVDHNEGVTFEVIAACKEVEGGFEFFDTCFDKSLKIRISKMREEEFSHISEDESNELAERYNEKLSTLSEFMPGEELAAIRGLEFLDASRDPEFPDDVQVMFLKDGMDREICWLRMEGISFNKIAGVLDADPSQDFGCSAGDTVLFYVQEMEDGRAVCIANRNEEKTITNEELEDGRVLNSAIEGFRENISNETFIEVLQVLKDSMVYIPCNIIPFDGEVPEGEEPPKAQLVPMILKDGDNELLPVFSRKEDMGGKAEEVSSVREYMDVALDLAENNGEDIKGIIVNPFTSPFVMGKEVFDIFRNNIKSRLEEEK